MEVGARVQFKAPGQGWTGGVVIPDPIAWRGDLWVRGDHDGKGRMVLPRDIREEQ